MSVVRLFQAGMLGLVLLVVPPLARATARGHNGRIAFMRKDARGFWQTWVARADLSGATQLTREAADSGYATWAPGGGRLAFDTNRNDAVKTDSKPVNDIYTMRPDGSGIAKLTDSRGSSSDPGWSPDGSLIAFASDRGEYPAKQGIYVMRADGSGLRRVTALPAGMASDLAPRFSPDGRRLVFTRYRGEGRVEKAALFVVGVDGSGLRPLTSFAIHAGDADWAPNGRTIVFEAYSSPASYGDVYVIPAAGGRPTNLTRNPTGHAGSADPVWAPDGSKILFLDNRRVGGVGRTGLATMRADGNGRRFVARGTVEQHQPDWESRRSR